LSLVQAVKQAMGYHIGYTMAAAGGCATPMEAGLKELPIWMNKELCESDIFGSRSMEPGLLLIKTAMRPAVGLMITIMTMVGFIWISIQECRLAGSKLENFGII